MPLTRGRALLIAAFVCGAMLTACHDSPDDRQATAAASNKPKANANKHANDLPPEMVAAVAPGRSAALISVHFALGNSPTVGRALPVAIAIVPHRDFLSVRAHFEARDGLAVTAGAEYGPITEIAPEKPLKHEITLMPSRDGVYMVIASVDTEDNEGAVTRVFSIPVIVSPEARAPAVAAPAPTPAKPPTS